MSKELPNIDHLHRFDGRRLLREADEIFMHSYYQEFCPGIERALLISKEHIYYKDPVKHLGLQLGLLQTLQSVEEASSKGNKLARQESNDELAMQSKRNKYIAKAYKEIADGVAWRTLGYNRFTMRILAQGVYSGNTWGKDEGQTTELKKAATAATNGAFVLVNDITNCLRVGDLTLVETVKSGEAYLAEVKRKEFITPLTIMEKIKRNRALDVQEERLVQAQLALEDKVMRMGSQDYPALSITPLQHDVLNGAGAALKKATKLGFIDAMLTPYMRLQAFDLSTLSDKNPESVIPKSNVGPNATAILEISSYDRLLMSAAGQLVRSSPPFTVFPWPAKTVAKLITGQLLMVTTIYLEPLQEAFLKLGWELIIDKDAIEAYEPRGDDSYTKDFSGRIFMPYDMQDSYSHITRLHNPRTGFSVTIGDFLLQMSTEFTTARFIVSVAEAVEEDAALSRPEIKLKWPDLRDARRWQ